MPGAKKHVTGAAMTRNTWMQHTPALVGTIIALGLALIPQVRQPALDSKKEQSQHHTSHAENLDARTAPVHEQSSTSEYKPYCAKKQDADLCVQFRIAESTEIQALNSTRSFWALVAALFAAGWAAWEARKAALHSRNSNQLVLDGQRPWVVITSLTPTETVVASGNELVVSVRAHLKNVGNSPAANVSAEFYAKVASRKHDGWQGNIDALIVEKEGEFPIDRVRIVPQVTEVIDATLALGWDALATEEIRPVEIRIVVIVRYHVRGGKPGYSKSAFRTTKLEIEGPGTTKPFMPERPEFVAAKDMIGEME